MRSKKKSWPDLKGKWVDQGLRDEVVDFVKDWHFETKIGTSKILRWLKINPQKYYDWKDRYGLANEHNGLIPRDFWLLDEEKKSIIDFHQKNPRNGYRRLTYMLNDADVVAVSPSTVRTVLKSAGLMDKKFHKKSLKGTGFHQPSGPHRHWHIDITYINIQGTFYYMASVLDGYSRSILDWTIDSSMDTAAIEILLQRTKEKYPGFSPRVISDNGPQFIANDFKSFIRLSGMSHVRTSPYYPQSNGKIEAMHKTLKTECIRPYQPRSVEEARKVVGNFVNHYNTERLHAGIGYVTPHTKLAGDEEELFKQRDERLDKARATRKQVRQQLKRKANGDESKAIDYTVKYHRMEPAQQC